MSINSNNNLLNEILSTIDDLPTSKEEQEKSITIVENGTTEVIPDENKTLSKVTVNVEVEQSGGGDVPSKGFVPTAWDEKGMVTSGIVYGFTEIPTGYFYNYDNYNSGHFYKLENVILPQGLTSIGENGFRSCGALALEELPDTIEHIAGFSGCTKLKLRKLPDNLKDISSYCFFYCKNLALTYLPEGVVLLGSDVFNGCTSLALSSLPKSITDIKNNTFDKCSSITISELNEGVTNIGARAFGNCTSITEMKFRGTPLTISTTAFAGCSNLLNIYVPWAEGAVANAPWGATNATIHYNTTFDENGNPIATEV